QSCDKDYIGLEGFGLNLKACNFN
ncbi:hypothetical protein OLS73_01295, partial [Campylobacter jejuni]|nr:hypothetical protein [Campylobacter jejuni]